MGRIYLHLFPVVLPFFFFNYNVWKTRPALFINSLQEREVPVFSWSARDRYFHSTLRDPIFETLSLKKFWAMDNIHNNSQLCTKISCGIIKAQRWKIINSLSITLMFITAKTKCRHNTVF